MSQPQCSLCLSDLKDEEDKQALHCMHVFHQECISQLLSHSGCTLDSVACPICKHTSLNEVEVGNAATGPANGGDQDGADEADHSDAEKATTLFSALFSNNEVLSDAETADIHEPADAEDTPAAVGDTLAEDDTPVPKLPAKAQVPAPKAKTHAKAKGKARAPPQETARPPVPVAPLPPSWPKAHCSIAFPLRVAPRCSSCGLVVEVAKLRVVNKSKGLMRCNNCNTVCTKLSRGLGAWPTSEWREVAEAEQQSFMQTCHSLSGAECIVKAKSMLEHYRSDQSFYEGSGEFYHCQPGKIADSK